MFRKGPYVGGIGTLLACIKDPYVFRKGPYVGGIGTL